MLTLALDTSSADGSVALFDNQKLLDSRHWSKLNSHCEILPDQIFRLLEKQNRDLREIKLVAVGIGPGSFTGIRVAVNFARTLAYANQIRVLTCDSLQLMAQQVHHSDLPICCIQFGFRNLLYIAKFKLDQGRPEEISAPTAITIEEFLLTIKTPHLILGTGYEYCRPYIKTEQIDLFKRDSQYLDYPASQYFSKLIEHKNSSEKIVHWTKVEPLYIRASEAEEKLKIKKSTNL